jgi:hypothetical protein
MRCPSCGFENASGIKFCGECGKPLAHVAKRPGRRAQASHGSLRRREGVDGQTLRKATDSIESVRAFTEKREPKFVGR